MPRETGGGLAAAALAALLALVAAGCAATPATVALPRKPQPLQLARAAAVRPSLRQVLVAAYEGYWQATGRALASRSSASARAMLTGHVPRSAIPGIVSGMSAMWARGEVAFGTPAFHIMSVRMTGQGTAAVHDCIDLSHTGFQDQRTGQVVGSLGQSHDYLITTLALQQGRWVVTGAIPVVEPCKY